MAVGGGGQRCREKTGDGHFVAGVGGGVLWEKIQINYYHKKG